MKALTLRLDDDLYEALRIEAFEKRTTISDLIRCALLRQGPITSAQIAEARELLEPECYFGHTDDNIRAALEAARDAS